jgi:hypothetical protein
VFENRVLRRIFGPNRDKVTGEWRKMHNDELHNLYSCPNIIGLTNSTRMRWTEYVARMGEKRVQDFRGKAEGKRPIGRPRRRWDDGIRTDLRENGLDSFGSGQGPEEGSCEHGDEPPDSGATELVM